MKRILLLCFLIPTFLAAQTWQQIANFPGMERDNGVSFTIANKAYCLTGMRINGTCGADGYVLDGNTHTWDTISSLPLGQEREYVTAFSCNGFGYLFGGLDCSNNCHTEMWRYDSQNDLWQGMTPIPAAGRMGCVCFVLNGKAYLIGGRTTGLVILDEVWEYDVANDSWLQKNNLPFAGMWRGNGFSIDTLGYVCYGIMNTLNFPHAIYQYNKQADSWSTVGNLSLSGRTYAECAVVNQVACLYGGVDSAGGAPKNDLIVFDPVAQTLTTQLGLPAVSRRSGIAFSLNNYFYLTTGIDSAFVRLKETWKVGSINRIKEYETENTIEVYPNPVSDILHVEVRGERDEVRNVKGEIEIRNMLGEKVMSLEAAQKTSIDVNGLPDGVYFLNLKGDGLVFTRKFVVRH